MLKLRNKNTGDEVIIAGNYTPPELVNGSFEDTTGMFSFTSNIKQYGKHVEVSIVFRLGKIFDENEEVGTVTGIDIPTGGAYLDVKSLNASSVDADRDMIFKLSEDGKITTIKPTTSDNITREYVMKAIFLTD
jgi:hypothetical protein